MGLLRMYCICTPKVQESNVLCIFSLKIVHHHLKGIFLSLVKMKKKIPLKIDTLAIVLINLPEPYNWIS